MKNIILKVCLVVSLAVILPSVTQAQFYVFDEGDLTGEAAPDFTLDTIRKKNVNLTLYREGQDAIVYFWATWCPNCGQYLKDLNDRQAMFEKEKVKVLAVNIGDPKNQVEKYLKKHKIDLDIFLDAKGEVEAAYQVYGVPTFYFVNGEGKITAVRHLLPEDFLTLLRDQHTEMDEIDAGPQEKSAEVEQSADNMIEKMPLVTDKMEKDQPADSEKPETTE